MIWWKRNFMIAEGGLAVAVTAGFAFWLYLYDGSQYVRLEGSGETIAILVAFMGLFGTLLGFIIATITFMFGFMDKNAFDGLRANHSYASHWAIFKGCLRSCAFATLMSFCGVVALWINAMPLALLVIIFGSTVWLIARFARVLWVMQNMIDANVRMGSATRSKLQK
jgi:hypothetical protein